MFASLSVCVLFMCLYGYIPSVDEWMNGDERWTLPASADYYELSDTDRVNGLKIIHSDADASPLFNDNC